MNKNYQSESEDESLRELTLEIVSAIADKNRDGTMHDEWAQVYREINRLTGSDLHYDVHFSSPRDDLSLEMMGAYVEDFSSKQQLKRDKRELQKNGVLKI